MSLKLKSCEISFSFSLSCILIRFGFYAGYECMRTRPSVDGAPDCFADLVCENGGTKTFESDKCWCLCPATWQGDFDCSKPTRDVTDYEPGSDICKLTNRFQFVYYSLY